MPNANFVCTVCSQTFTRKWRGSTHNTALHYGNATIVRLIDYMIGRLSGQYLPSNPSLYRRKNGLSLTGNNTVGNLSQLQSPSQASIDEKKESENLFDTIRENQNVIIKMAELKKILDKHASQDVVKQAMNDVVNCCCIAGNYKPLDIALDCATKQAKYAESKDYLSRT